MKVIELLNLVYEKKAPKRVLYKYCEYEYVESINDYRNKYMLELFSYLFQNEERALYLEVEIIEEIEKPNIPQKISFKTTETQKEKNRLIKDTINQIIDYLEKSEEK